MPTETTRGNVYGGAHYLPSEPILRYFDEHPDEVAGWDSMTTGAIASATRRLRAARTTGRISFDAADKICCLMQVHLSEVYGDLYWETRLDDQEDRILLAKKAKAARMRSARLRLARLSA